MNKIYVPEKIYDQLRKVSLYNQKIGEALEIHDEIGLSDGLCGDRVRGCRIHMFLGYDVPHLVSEFMIKYGIKKND
jgi:hypothetical protein